MTRPFERSWTSTEWSRPELVDATNGGYRGPRSSLFGSSNGLYVGPPVAEGLLGGRSVLKREYRGTCGRTADPLLRRTDQGHGVLASEAERIHHGHFSADRSRLFAHHIDVHLRIDHVGAEDWFENPGS